MKKTEGEIFTVPETGVYEIKYFVTTQGKSVIPKLLDGAGFVKIIPEEKP